MKDTKMTQTEILEIKNIRSELKNTPHGINSTLGTTKEKKKKKKEDTSSRC